MLLHVPGHALPDRRQSIAEAHFPPPGADMEALNLFRAPAQQRLIFEECFLFQAGLILRKRRHADRAKPQPVIVDGRQVADGIAEYWDVEIECYDAGYVPYSKLPQTGFDGVVCGHIHKAEVKDIDGVLYGNSGDWVESLSALVEHPDGRLEVVYWTQLLGKSAHTPHEAASANLEPTPETTCAS